MMNGAASARLQHGAEFTEVGSRMDGIDVDDERRAVMSTARRELGLEVDAAWMPAQSAYC